MRTARMSARLVAVVAVVAALFTPVALVGCGGDDGTAEAPSRTPSVADKPSFPAPSDTPSPRGVARIDVAGHLVVARADGTGWALWRVTPSTAVERRIGELPSTPTDALASPDGRRVAYLVPPRPALDQVGVAVLETDTGAIDLLPQKGSGLWGADGMTWLSSTKLLVSGPRSKAARSYPIDDALRVYDLRSGEVEPFGAESGTEPSAALDAGEIVFDRLTKLGQEQSSTIVREELVVVSLETGVETVLQSAEYTAYTPGRMTERPCASPDGSHILTARTGSDTGVGWVLWRREDDAPLWTRETSMAYPLHAAWDAPGRRIAYWGMPANLPVRTFIWVYDVREGAWARSKSLGKGILVPGLDWSSDGDLVASSWRFGTDPPAQTVIVAPGGDLSAFAELCEGMLPVWVE